MDESDVDFKGPIPKDVLRSFHTQERNIFHKLVFNLDMEPISAMGVIAFWMWLESVGHPCFTQRMANVPDDTLLRIAAEGEPCLAAVLLDPSTPLAHDAMMMVPTVSRVPGSPIDLGYLHSFWMVAREGIISILNDVCPRIFDDMLTAALSRRAEGGKGRSIITYDVGEGSSRVGETSYTRVQIGNSILGPYNRGKGTQRGFRQQPRSPTQGGAVALIPFRNDASSTVPYGDGTGRGSYASLPLLRSCMQGNRVIGGYQEIALPEGWNIFSRNILNMQQRIQPNTLQMLLNQSCGTPSRSSNGERGMGRLPLPASNTSPFAGAADNKALVPRNNMGTSARPSAFFTLMLQRSKPHPRAHIWSPEGYIPPDERTLFITFSNGYPLEAFDLYEFFNRRYGAVEDIYIQEVEGDEQPLYARAVFYLQAICLRVLAGNEKAKFIIKGRHVWARRYIPKRKKRAGFKEMRWWRPMRPSDQR